MINKISIVCIRSKVFKNSLNNFMNQKRKMNSIEAMESEINRQILEIPKIKRLARIESVHNCIFVGSGDSYVVGLICSYLTNFNARCIDPADMLINPSISSGKTVFIISISGKTQENILVARKIRKYSNKLIAVTNNLTSQLAKNCDDVVYLDYKNTGVTTAGTLSFVISMLTCANIVGKYVKVDNLSSIYEKSKRKAKVLVSKTENLLRSPGRGSIIFLGNSILFPISIYGSLKINEVFGWKSFAYSLENFCHAPLFEITEDDLVLVFSSPKHSINDKVKKLIRLLKKRKLNAIVVEIPDHNDIKILLFSTMLIQSYVVRLAKTLKNQECYFLENTELLNLSSQLIYNTK